MSESANKEVVRAFVSEVFQGLDPDAVDRLVGADFKSHTWGQSGGDRDYLKQATQRLAGALADIRFTVDDLIEEDDRVAARLTASATATGDFMGMPAAGKSYTIGEIHIFRLRDGKIVEHWHQYDGLAMMRELGGGGDRS